MYIYIYILCHPSSAPLSPLLSRAQFTLFTDLHHRSFFPSPLETTSLTDHIIISKINPRTVDPLCVLSYIYIYIYLFVVVRSTAHVAVVLPTCLYPPICHVSPQRDREREKERDVSTIESYHDYDAGPWSPRGSRLTSSRDYGPLSPADPSNTANYDRVLRTGRLRFVVPGEALKPPGLQWHCPRPPGDSAQACSFSSTLPISQPPPPTLPPSSSLTCSFLLLHLLP